MSWRRLRTTAIIQRRSPYSIGGPLFSKPNAAERDIRRYSWDWIHLDTIRRCLKSLESRSKLRGESRGTLTRRRYVTHSRDRLTSQCHVTNSQDKLARNDGLARQTREEWRTRETNSRDMTDSQDKLNGQSIDERRSHTQRASRKNVFFYIIAKIEEDRIRSWNGCLPVQVFLSRGCSRLGRTQR